MGKLQGTTITGSFGNLSAYHIQGSKDVIVRTKGGPRPSAIKRHERFAQTRLNNAEFKSSVAMSKKISNALGHVAELRDYNFAPTLNGLCRHLHQLDTGNEKGRRSALLSHFPSMLEGFSMNKFDNLESILRNPLVYTMDRASGSATIQVPAILPGINLLNPKKHLRYRFYFMLGHVADQVYNENYKRHEAIVELPPAGGVAFSHWHHWDAGSESETIQVNFNYWVDQPGVSLILSGGVGFGTPLSNDFIKPVERAGAGKVLKVG